MGYQRPVPYSRSTSWAEHKRRRPPSTEAGIDMFCRIGTPVLAAESGRIVDTGDSIGPATGRFVTLDIDDGRRARYLHLSRRVVDRGDRVRRGQVLGYSGATGYGEEDWSWNVAETGGAHVHMTLWPSQRYVFGSTGTLDPEPFFDAVEQVAGLTATPILPKEWDEMATEEQVANVTRTAAAEAVVNALKDKSVTDTLALVVKNELAQKMYAGDLSLIPIAELGNAMFLRASSTRRRIQVQNEDHVRFVQRALENRGTDIMSSAEVDIVDAYCLAVYPPDAIDVDVVALSAALNAISKDQSTETIRAAVDAAINAHTSTIAFVQKPAS